MLRAKNTWNKNLWTNYAKTTNDVFIGYFYIYSVPRYEAL